MIQQMFKSKLWRLPTCYYWRLQGLGPDSHRCSAIGQDSLGGSVPFFGQRTHYLIRPNNEKWLFNDLITFRRVVPNHTSVNTSLRFGVRCSWKADTHLSMSGFDSRPAGSSIPLRRASVHKHCCWFHPPRRPSCASIMSSYYKQTCWQMASLLVSHFGFFPSTSIFPD